MRADRGAVGQAGFRVRSRLSPSVRSSLHGSPALANLHSYPNEIIEWPVILLQWRRKRRRGEATCEAHEEGDDEDEDDWELVQTAEFHSFVKPIWRGTLSAFCTELTGITQVCRGSPRNLTCSNNLAIFVARRRLGSDLRTAVQQFSSQFRT